MKLKALIVLAGVAGALGVGSMMAIAQQGGGGGGFGGGGGGFGGGGGGRGNFDPAQMQAQMQEQMQNLYRELLEVKDDAEWKVIWEKVQGVTKLQAQNGFGGGMNLLRAAGRRANTNNNNNAQDATGNAQGGGRRRNNPGGGIQGLFGANAADPEGDALQKVIDSDGSTADLKAAIARYVEARKQKQAKLETAQGDLRKLLTVRQEAIAFSIGLL